MKRLLREPLLHFLLLGGAIFVIFHYAGKRGADPALRIVITPGEINSLAAGFERTWQRPPSGSELEGLIQERVRSEVYSREAVALGLDQGDPIIRNRLRLKLELISEDLAGQAEPTGDDLRAYLEQHPDDFRLEPMVAFRQIYFNPEKRGARVYADAEAALARLGAGLGTNGVAELGDTSLLPPQLPLSYQSDVAGQFGRAFAGKVAAAEAGRWIGPVESGFGVHLVFVQERKPGQTPPFEEIRDLVLREYLNARRREQSEAFYRKLRERYTVVVERPEPTNRSGVRGREGK